VAVTGRDESTRLTGRSCVLFAFVVQREQEVAGTDEAKPETEE